jgi:predicted SAM-dependent methyltransferase
MTRRAWLHAVRLYAQISAEVSGASTHAFIDRCFWRIWRQAAELDLFVTFADAIDSRRLTRFGLVRIMTAAPQHVQAVRTWKHYSMLETLHLTRCKMVRQLPAADTIVDIGGAAPASVQGALLVMGYRHRFKALTIVDLPPDRRLGKYAQSSAEAADGWIATELGPLRYVHGSMTDLSAIADPSADLVFSGQSIEHVSVDEGKRVLCEVHRVLRPGGTIFLDTPNAALTRLQSPQALIHPEHKVEYHVGELVNLVRSAGFVMEKVGGICPMPRSLRTGVFDEREAIRNGHLSRRPEEAYLFYVQARKA